MKYSGSCHCGQIAFEAEGKLGEVLACNCSICARKGSLLWFLPRSAMQLKTPEEALATYTFNRHAIQHRFCPRCGIHPFGEGRMPDGQAMVAINVRCLEGVDLEGLAVRHYDGRAL